MAALQDQRTWSVIDHGERGGWHTEQGVIRPGTTRTALIHNEQTAKEIKAQDPLAIVVEHEPMKGFGTRGQSMMIMPRLPFETTWDRKQREKREAKERAEKEKQSE